MIYYDITDLARHAKTSLTGIQRVVLEGLRGLGDQAKPIFMSPVTGKWYVLDQFDASALQDLQQFLLLWERADLIAYPTRSNVEVYLSMFTPAKNQQRAKRLHQRLVRVPFMRRRLNQITARFVQADLYRAPGGPNIRLLPSLADGDTVVLFGTPWHSLPQYENMLSSLPKGVEKVFLIYDLIPLNTPFVPDELRDMFRHFIPFALQHATRIIVNSDSVSHDLRNFARQGGFRLPPVTKINLAHCLPPTTFFPTDHSLRVRKLFIERFVLCVGSIESRKNHLNLLVMWSKFVRSPDYNGEKLVIAGSYVWDYHAIQNLIHETGHVYGSVIIIERASDDELRQLYRHCRFTAYPSHYEGWGLPIGESLSFGKPCLHFDNSSLREAGYGLTDIVPYHNLKWFYRSFKRLMIDDAYYASRCENIACNQALLRTWADFSKDVSCLFRQGGNSADRR